MKKLFIVSAAILVAAGLSQAQITGSLHDFSGDSWNGTGQICVVCHTPHTQAAFVKPLWNRTPSSATYTPYGTTTLGTAAGTPAGSSLVCLSCHDGTVGLGNFGGTTGDTTLVTGIYNIGTDLRNDHPISVTYTADATHALRATTTELKTGFTIAQALEGGQVQCGTCHAVHNESDEDKLLHSTNTASALCLKCHIK